MTRLQSCIPALAGDPFPRVWSLIVTFFGDMADGPGDVVSGTALAAWGGALGLRPEAVRTALHRLRTDGWIHSTRSGRGARHGLTARARAETANARPRVYGHPPEGGHWHVLVGEPDRLSAVGDGRHVRVNGALLGYGPAPDAPGLLTIEGAARLPDWVRREVCSPPEIRRWAELREALAIVDRAGLAPSDLAPIEIAALRTLIVHAWRRLVLRGPILPDAAFPADWPGPVCRDAVFQLLERFPRPTLGALEAASVAGQPDGRSGGALGA